MVSLPPAPQPCYQPCMHAQIRRFSHPIFVTTNRDPFKFKESCICRDLYMTGQSAHTMHQVVADLAVLPASQFIDSITLKRCDINSTEVSLLLSVLSYVSFIHIDGLSPDVLLMDDRDRLVVPPAIKTLQNLAYFSLTDMPFGGGLPSEMGTMKGLVYLELGGRGEGDCPPVITGTGSSQHPFLPTEMGRLTGLFRFLVNDVNMAVEGPTSPVFSRLVGLDKLLMNRNCLPSLPVGLTNLRQLNKLDVKDNRLTSLESLFAEGMLSSDNSGESGNSSGVLNALKFLFLDANKITALPSGLENLSSLIFISAPLNRINDAGVPPSLQRLRRMDTLNLAGNRLNHLPVEAMKAPRLRWINLEGNNISTHASLVAVAEGGEEEATIVAPLEDHAFGTTADSGTRKTKIRSNDAGLVLLGYNGVCAESASFTTARKDFATTVIGDVSWTLRCEEQCSVGCISEKWGPGERYTPDLSDPACVPSCNTTECGWQNGNCLA